MTLITIRVLDGPERGKEFPQIATPVTIGREEGNTIQLNDHRVSRHHLKIHHSDDALFMTDLQSTNGTKINGEAVRIWKMHPGDLITIGQSILLFGSPREIAIRLASLKKEDLASAISMGEGGDESEVLNRIFATGPSDWTRSSQLLLKEVFGSLNEEDLSVLHKLPLPIPPKNLSPEQAAQMEAFLQYLHIRFRCLVSTVRTTPAESGESEGEAKITLSSHQWQNIVDLHAKIATYLSDSLME